MRSSESSDYEHSSSEEEFKRKLKYVTKFGSVIVDRDTNGESSYKGKNSKMGSTIYDKKLQRLHRVKLLC